MDMTDDFEDMLAKYLIEKSKGGELDICAAVIENSSPSTVQSTSPSIISSRYISNEKEQRQQRIITDTKKLIKIAVDCIYADTATNHCQIMSNIFKVLLLSFLLFSLIFNFLI